MTRLYTVNTASEIAERIYEFWIRAPQVARNARAGQFLILRIDEQGERIPLTISAVNGDAVRVVFMAVGKTTQHLATLKAGDALADVVGPLGKPSEIENFGTACVVGGGAGIACLPIIARELKEAGNHVIGIIGARNAGLLILEDEMREICDELFITTDDGSKGFHGYAADVLKRELDHRTIDRVWIIGPAIMMKVTSAATVPYGVKTFVSLNPIMVDGTGMCGSCRVTVGGETKFACVDGPEFDAHQVDFVELMQRQRIYTDQEKAAVERFAEHTCRCGEGGHHHG
ncbi:sulfide/dihydroorotate dehydrogenase-like FAD/NAD-binding protein [Methanoculleus taiwanensis]|uniref:sulfide/dihydroorotate dehydrogenase-like FAD/NAD-binding protein n=1 Tax=Methanoculleus taiwanensis TaxID=1550565 RepID=UPI001F4F99E2|nr:sulfide/dihydroorotate dehydrogenase-like FAD/NAD-binding protein [Methanoculleus taiwanensis]